MAYQNPNTAAVASLGQPAAPARQFERASAYLNLYVPVTNDDGSTSRRKIGAIALKNSRKMDRNLIELLSEPSNVEKLQAKIELDFNVVEDSDGEIAFAL